MPPRPDEPDRERDGRRVVVRDEGVLGAGQRDEVVLGDARPGPALAGRAIELEEQVAASARSAAPAATAAGHGARPRFVWTMTPVALMTGSTPGRANASSRARASAARAAGVASRTRFAVGESRTLVAHDLADDGGQRAPGRRRRASGPSRREDGLDARRSRTPVAGRSDLDDIGSSVAGARGSRTHHATPSAASPVLKTGGPTGTHPLPARW